MYKIEGVNLQCMNNPFAKFEYKRMKIVEVTYYTNQTPPTHFGWKNVLRSTSVKNEKIFIKCAQNGKMGGAHLQCVNNHYAKFENKKMKTVGVTDYTHQNSSKHFGRKNV